MAQDNTQVNVSVNFNPDGRQGNRTTFGIGVRRQDNYGTYDLKYNTNGTTSLSVQNPYGYGATLSRPGF